MYLRQISLTGGIPFPIKLPDAPKEVNLEKMTIKDIEYKLDKGYDDALIDDIKVFVKYTAKNFFHRKVKG
jgi:hypothetical protein